MWLSVGAWLVQKAKYLIPLLVFLAVVAAVLVACRLLWESGYKTAQGEYEAKIALDAANTKAATAEQRAVAAEQMASAVVGLTNTLSKLESNYAKTSTGIKAEIAKYGQYRDCRVTDGGVLLYGAAGK